MALRTFVKISSVNNLSDARYCAGMQVNLMGFNLEENNKNYTSPEKFREITDWLSGVEFVAEFESAHPDSILKKLSHYEGFQYIQIKEDIHVNLLANTAYSLILLKEIQNLNELEELIKKAPSYNQFDITILLTSPLLEINNAFEEKIKELASICPVLLGFGLEAENVLQLIEKTGVKGIALEGGDEIKPGLKDFDDLAEILEILEIED
ncbi:phosphoribosylanthranilate isomerase [Cecembia calidifontis]|uniref:phosphoribosylanthranilate isomerase n=1 Tax=Cecembia calidifontis TaxID=1187080 RepID=A0A4Q7PBK3_9BACT|nr:phosphoribosylanthranilate isomerase [Cecembia calidifontis]RZS97078.1 phosphoribosylanthranilate isomerase [Cecembia calidifontis]